MSVPKFQLVSTIIPVYNRSKMLRESVDSVLRQTHQALEVIVVDDGSTDDTAEVGPELERQHSGIVRYFRQSNAGPGAARNTGLSHARGEFIQYLDSDDLLEPRKLELQLQAFDRAPDADVCYCGTLRRNLQTGAEVVWAKTGEDIRSIFPDFLPKRGWATLTPLWRRSLCHRIGPWAQLRVMEDWEHDLRAGLLGARIVRVPEMLAVVRDHGVDRASGMNSGFTPALTRDYFLAHESIWRRMQEAGRTDSSYLSQFAKTVFWIARMCGERGLIPEAERALGCAEEMTRMHGSARRIKAFRAATRCLGWRTTVRISEFVHRVGPQRSPVG
jgi:glycosyltransferase involved in cell wall biosynthesis